MSVFKLYRLGVIMGPEPGNKMEEEGGTESRHNLRARRQTVLVYTVVAKGSSTHKTAAQSSSS
ncbi:hypothetical protein AAEO56_11895 [Flavobacterium sp. DGU11]|uniref:OmpA-like domain-containing protein n=1 Tax=Flavobacterium arundinis TaxID=3139143 RepID=A0ABU9HXR7_9FLAO